MEMQRPTEEEVKSMVQLCHQLVEERLEHSLDHLKIEMRTSVDRLFKPFHGLIKNPNRLCLSNFKMIHIITEGGFGRIWKCTFKETPVVIKEPLKGTMDLQNCLVERDMLLNLKHKRVVKLLGFFFEGNAFYVLEYCLGALADFTLAEIGWPNLVRFVYQSFDALAWIHSKQCIHRDVKPENFLITTGNNLVLTDFGSACKLKKGAKSMLAKYPVGTCDMLDPQALRRFKFGYATDVFGAACGWFEIVSGKPLLGPKFKLFYNPNDQKAEWNHHADSFELGRIKEKLDNETKSYVPVLDDNSEFVREPIKHRIDTCPVITELLRKALDPNPDNRPSASKILDMKCMHEYLRLYDVAMDRIDSGNMWTALADKTKSAHLNASEQEKWSKVQKDVAKTPYTPEWWKYVILTQLYYDGLDEPVVSTNSALANLASPSALCSPGLVATANKMLAHYQKTNPIPVAKNPPTFCHDLGTDNAQTFSKARKSAQPIQPDLAFSIQHSEEDLDVPLPKRLRVGNGVGPCAPKQVKKIVESPSSCFEISGVFNKMSTMSVDNVIGFVETLTPQPAEQSSTAGSKPSFATPSGMAWSEHAATQKSVPENLTSSHFESCEREIVKKCKINDCNKVCSGKHEYKHHLETNHPGVILCEYCFKFVCNKQAKLNKHLLSCKNKPQ